jgi:hypothetical protein
MRHPFILEGAPLKIKIGTSSSYAGNAGNILSALILLLIVRNPTVKQI